MCVELKLWVSDCPEEQPGAVSLLRVQAPGPVMAQERPRDCYQDQERRRAPDCSVGSSV